jgi:hypothetical protein
VLLVLQNLVIVSSSTVTTARLEYEPTGLYQVQVIVSGYGFLSACASNNVTIAIDDVNTITGTPESVANIYTVADNTCLLTWRCPSCQLSTGSVPSFTVTTNSLAWVNFYYYNVTAPVMVTRTGGLFDRNPVSLSVSQLMFPTTDPANDRVAFRSYYADQSVNILMTGTTIVDSRPNMPVVYASYQPSILSIAKRQATLNGPQPYMSNQSPIAPPMSRPAGFKLQIIFQRNTITVTRYSELLLAVSFHLSQFFSPVYVFIMKYDICRLFSTIPPVSVLNLLALFASVASTLISVMQLLFARMELMFSDRNRAHLSPTLGQPQIELGTKGVLSYSFYYLRSVFHRHLCSKSLGS